MRVNGRRGDTLDVAAATCAVEVPVPSETVGPVKDQARIEPRLSRLAIMTTNGFVEVYPVGTSFA